MFRSKSTVCIETPSRGSDSTEAQWQKGGSVRRRSDRGPLRFILVPADWSLAAAPGSRRPLR